MCRTKTHNLSRMSVFTASLLLLAASALAQQTVSGTVVDGTTGEGIFRALVGLNAATSQRAMLTDAEGRFSFANVDPVSVHLTVTKPGYYQTLGFEQGDSGTLDPASLGTPAVLRLYPEAILKGTVTGPGGEPLANIVVDVQHILNSETGRLTVNAGVARTNIHGQFRIPVPSGDYRVETSFTQWPPAGGHEPTAIMPLAFPEASPSGSVSGAASFHLKPGEQRDLDLRAARVSLVEVSLRANVDLREMGSITAIAQDGTSFPVRLAPNESAGQGQDFIARIPPGSFVLQARSRGFDPGGILQGNLSVVPSARQPVPATVQFAPISSIPIQVAIDGASTASPSGQPVAVPDARSLNLSLEPVQPYLAVNDQLLRPTQQRGSNTVSFTTPPGAYRLRANVKHGWYIVSASYGGGDVLTNPMVIGSGASGTPLELTLSNQAGSLHGKVTLDGTPAPCWIYLVTASGATPVRSLRSGADGTYSDSFVPPGSYRAVAFTHRVSIDLSEPGALAPYSTRAGSVTVRAGDNETLDLEAVADSEVQP